MRLRVSRLSTSRAALIAAGMHDVMIGAGVEHMGHVPFAAGMKTPMSSATPFTPELMASTTSSARVSARR